MTTIPSETTSILADLPEPLHQGWNRIEGVAVEGTRVAIDPAAYFFRYENPTWLLCAWDGVKADLLDAQETQEIAVEQMALDYINQHGYRTSDPAEVLTTAARTSVRAFFLVDATSRSPATKTRWVRRPDGQVRHDSSAAA